MKPPQLIFSAGKMDFPPCSSLDQVLFVEELLFAIFPTLTEFIRPVTAAEREAGIGNEYGEALVTKADGGMTRFYGTSIPLD